MTVNRTSKEKPKSEQNSGCRARETTLKDPTPARCRELRLIAQTYLAFEQAIEQAKLDGFELNHYRWAIKWAAKLRKKLVIELLNSGRWVGTGDQAAEWARSQQNGDENIR